MFIGMAWRSALKPECISAHTDRARARSPGWAGQTPCSGKRSARYSTMARVSQMTSSPATSTGTRPAGEIREISSWNPGEKRSWRSLKGMSSARISSQGRSDHDE